MYASDDMHLQKRRVEELVPGLHLNMKRATMMANGFWQAPVTFDDVVDPVGTAATLHGLGVKLEAHRDPKRPGCYCYTTSVPSSCSTNKTLPFRRVVWVVCAAVFVWITIRQQSVGD
jgi:hypothetical protein